MHRIKKAVVKLISLTGILSVFLFISILSITVVMLIGGSSSVASSDYISAMDGLPEILTNEMIVGAVETQEKYGVPAALTLAQIVLESSGSYTGNLSKLAYECKNLFGMKGIGTAGSKEYKTKEQTASGEIYTISAKFRVYHNFKESIDDHGQLLISGIYKSYTASAQTSDEWAYAIHKAGYATAVNYADNLISIMDMYDLYRFDGITVDTLSSVLEQGNSTGEYRWPLNIKGYISSYFGERDAPTAGATSIHQGLDIAANSGTPVYATDGGTVEFTGVYGSGGNTVIINHKNGVKSYYMHLRNADGIVVIKGAKVRKGQKIGRVGSTGISTGSHLHFQINVNGTPVNPLKYVIQPN